MSASPFTLLVTGFGPFPRMPRNPSGALARRVGRDARLRLLLGTGVRTLVLETSYRALDRELAPALASAPAAVLMIGVAGRAKQVRIEARAANRASRLFPDAGGRAAGRLALDPEGPAARRVPAGRAAHLLRREGLPVRVSRDAGRYLCNAAYYRALAEPCPVLFLHIPPHPRARPARGPTRPRRLGGEERRAAAFVALALDLVRLSRQRAAAGTAARRAT